MRYITHQVKWINEQEGTHPYEYLQSIYAKAENAFAINEVPNEIHYSYLISGDPDDFSINEWNISEITAEEFLIAAQDLGNNPFWENDKIVWSAGITSVLPPVV
jgi:hypothetical protein